LNAYDAMYVGRTQDFTHWTRATITDKLWNGLYEKNDLALICCLHFALHQITWQ